MSWISRGLWWLAFRVYGRIVPWRLVPFLSGTVALLLSIFGVRRKVAHVNLTHALGVSRGEARRLERKAFRHLLRVYFEMPLLNRLSPSRCGEILTVEHLDLLSDPQVSESGALLLSGHLGNWELLALESARASGVPFTIPVKEQRDFGHLSGMRERFGNRSLLLSSRSNREILQTLAGGGVVAMLPDQAPPREDPVVQFFGKPTHFFRGPAYLALKFRPVVITGFCRYRGKGAYTVQLQRLRYEDLGTGAEAERRFIERYAVQLEEAIRTEVSSWVWHHKRWKHSEEVHYA